MTRRTVLHHIHAAQDQLHVTSNILADAVDRGAQVGLAPFFLEALQAAIHDTCTTYRNLNVIAARLEETANRTPH